MSALVYLGLAALAGALAGTFRARRLPYAGVVCALAALIAAVTVSLPLGDQGPHLLEVAVLPALGGALAGAVLMRLVLARLVQRWQ